MQVYNTEDMNVRVIFGDIPAGVTREEGSVKKTEAGIVVVGDQVWIDGQRYQSVGEVDESEVSAGDLFLDTKGWGLRIEQVLSIAQSPEGDEPGVDMRLVYTESGHKNDVAEPPYEEATVTQKMDIEHYTGLSNPTMGYEGPPEKLEKVETE